MNFSRHFGLRIGGHQDIEFVDIPLTTDVKLFIDPELMRNANDAFSIAAWKSIRSYFDTLFSACSQQDYQTMNLVLSHVGEANETHLGLSRERPIGRGASRGILFPILADMIERDFFEMNLIVESKDLCVFANNFAEDRLSDVLINVIRNELCRFTISQANKHGVPLNYHNRYVRPYWDTNSQSWKTGSWPSLQDSLGRQILLVPKRIVRQTYVFTASWYLQHFVLSYRQQVHHENETSLCEQRISSSGRSYLKKPSKKLIYAEEITGSNVKDYISSVTKHNPDLMNDYRQAVKCNTRDYSLSDEELDRIVYRQQVKKLGA